MQNHHADATNLPEAEPTAPVEPPRRWQAEVIELLQHAAALCSEHNIDADAFMSKAWSAYVESRPGLRDQLEEAHLAAQLDELRKLGRMGSA